MKTSEQDFGECVFENESGTIYLPPEKPYVLVKWKGAEDYAAFRALSFELIEQYKRTHRTGMLSDSSTATHALDDEQMGETMQSLVPMLSAAGLRYIAIIQSQDMEIQKKADDYEALGSAFVLIRQFPTIALAADWLQANSDWR